MRREQRVTAHGVPTPPDGVPEAYGPPALLPGARVRHGEHPRATVVRAFAEQQGVAVEPVRVIDVVADVTEEPGDVAVHTVRVVYAVRPALARPGRAPGPDADGAGRDGVVAGPPKVQRVGAYALVTDRDRLLLTRYSTTRRWSLPGGGIDHGEQPRAALDRELHEETGLVLGDVRLIDVDSVHFTGHAPDGTLEDFHAVRIVYGGTVPPGARPEVVEVGGSSDAAAWIPLADVETIPRTGFVAVALRLLR